MKFYACSDASTDFKQNRMWTFFENAISVNALIPKAAKYRDLIWIELPTQFSQNVNMRFRSKFDGICNYHVLTYGVIFSKIAY
jgi:hypothetical protein